MVKCDKCQRAICVNCQRECDNTNCMNNDNGYCSRERCEKEEE